MMRPSGIWGLNYLDYNNNFLISGILFFKFWYYNTVKQFFILIFIIWLPKYYCVCDKKERKLKINFLNLQIKRYRLETDTTITNGTVKVSIEELLSKD